MFKYLLGMMLLSSTVFGMDLTIEEERRLLNAKYKQNKGISIIPGIYKSQNKSGAEVTVFHGGTGYVLGWENMGSNNGDKLEFRYAEVEMVIPFSVLGAGLVFDEGEVGGLQMTGSLIVLPLPIFPYARYSVESGTESKEVGLMIKIPIT